MRLAIPAQERPARNVLIAGFKCAKIMPNRVERVSRFSARPAFYSIERSTRSLHQQTTGKIGSEKELRGRGFGSHSEPVPSCRFLRYSTRFACNEGEDARRLDLQISNFLDNPLQKRIVCSLAELTTFPPLIAVRLELALGSQRRFVIRQFTPQTFPPPRGS